MSILAISARENSENSLFEERYGRSAFFVIYNTVTKTYTVHENKHANEINGAGIKTSEMLINLQVDKIFTGRIGPKAKSVLEKTAIECAEKDWTNKRIKDIIEENAE